MPKDAAESRPIGAGPTVGRSDRRHERAQGRRARGGERAIPLAAGRQGEFVTPQPPQAPHVPKRRRRARALARHEYFRALHSPADRDHLADDGGRARRPRGLSAAAGGAAAQVDFPTINVSASLAGRKPRDHGLGGGAAARASIRADSRRHADDVDEHARLHLDSLAVRSQPQHRRGGAGRAGGDQRRRTAIADRSALAAHLPQGQPGRFPHPGAWACIRTRCRSPWSTTTPTRSWRSRCRRSPAWRRSRSAASRSRRCACRSTRPSSPTKG